MKKLNRFVAKCAMVLLLLTFLLPAINWGQFLSNLTPVAFAVPACADIPDQPTCDGYAPACYWDGSCQTNECGDGVEGGPGEECDDGNSDPDDGCSEYCLVEYCGDSIQQA
ncbi:hypothetical protein JW752_03965, partial [Candidatus Peregrinibacteria bacterium]|nr:hypothetical protein [Candidatus Peregrinibacteria bacterium]